LLSTGCAGAFWVVAFLLGFVAVHFLKVDIECLMLARFGHGMMSELSPLLDEQRKTYARPELFRF
jgi:hypothetical protein